MKIMEKAETSTTAVTPAFLKWISRGVIELQETPKKLWFPVGMILGLLMFSGLFYGAYNFLYHGHHTLANSKEVPWNLFIVMYAFAISSIGLSYIASFGIVLGIKQFDVIARRALFLAILIINAGMISVAADMRQPLHAMYLILTTHPTSPLGVVAITINLYLLLIMAELYLLIKRGHEDRLVRIVATAAFGTALVVHSFHGAIFGLAHSRAFWSGPYYPIYFLLSALFCSSSIILLVTYGTYKVTGVQITAKLENTLRDIGKMLVYLLGIGMFFLFWKMTYAWYVDKPETKLLFVGPYAINFWVFEVLLGYLIPIILIVISQYNLRVMAFAAFLALVGLFMSRYDFIIVGQLSPYLGFAPFGSELGGSTSKLGLAAYMPNFVEIATGIGLLGMVLTAYVLGCKFLPLSKDELASEELQPHRHGIDLDDLFEKPMIPEPPPPPERRWTGDPDPEKSWGGERS
jgi:molybdopterin-containing oxidoreductase family membrane subunit